MPIFRHRDRTTILAEILKTTKESERGKTKTNIVQSVNLNYHQVNKYLQLLLVNGLLYKEKDDRYKPTKRGLEIMKNLERLNLRLDIE
jgi:predicted transcriptional regulator